jgi:DNA recombination protein RmuC
MDIAAIALVVIGVLAAGVAVGAWFGRSRSGGAVERAVSSAVALAQRDASAQRDAAVRAALAHAAVLNGEQLNAHLAAGQQELAAKKDVIDSRLDQIRTEVTEGLERMNHALTQLGQRNAEQFGRVGESLMAHAEITRTLSATTQGLREALANSKVRGQWGERMAEDVLRLAGFQERVNYVKQTAVAGGRALPDFTFFMPRDHVLYMDVKFPLTSYLRFLDASTDAERSTHLAAFLRDVRLRVKELAARDYARAGDRRSVDYVLLFLPNESLASFIHEHDPAAVEDALAQRVVMCSPTSLFTLLCVIRQAFDQFVMEETSREMLGLLGTFTQQWGKYTESIDKVRARFDAVQREFDALATTRRRQLERPLHALDDLRVQRGLAVDVPAGADHGSGGEVLELDGYREAAT